MSAAVLSSTRRAKLARTLVVLSLSILIGGGYAMSAGAGDQQISTTQNLNGKYVTVTVAPGETLWSILTKFTSGENGGDTRSLVDQVISINSLPGADVEAGQKLRIPLPR